MTRIEQILSDVSSLPNYFWVNGKPVGAAGRDTFETRDPGSNTLLVAVPAATAEDVDDVVAVAKKALSGPWAKMLPKDRGRLLWAIGEAVRADIERLALIETLDTGKPLKDARVTVQRAADYFCYYAGIVDKLQGESIPLGPDKVCFTERVPIGVTGHIVPWNVPISMVARSVAPALACGNTAVVKPAEDTPLTAILLAEIIEKIGVPAGVVNVITGRGSVAGKALAEHPDVHHVTFTGSVATGKSIATSIAKNLASVTLELGGKSPHVILRDADLNKAVPDILAAVFKNAGQICSAGTRLLVEKSIHTELLEQLVENTKSMHIGHGLDNPDMGPLISARQHEAVCGFTERARERGISFAIGGDAMKIDGHEGGHFFAPSIAENVPRDDELAQSEVFGPVLSVIPFDDFDEAIEIANDTRYGLAAGIHTRDISKAMRFARAVQAGQVFINGYHSAGDTVPFGGFKSSGVGREKGIAALDSYCEVKAITISI